MHGAGSTTGDDLERFEDVFTEHHTAIWRYLARLGGRERADDLAGEVFLVAFRRRATYDPTRGPLSAWLYGIATNVYRNHVRSEWRRARAFTRAAANELVTTSPIDDIIDRRTRVEHLHAVARALARLSSQDREILVLFAWEGLSYEQIADALNMELGTVRSRLSRTRQRLRAHLAGRDTLTRKDRADG
jgi:RNA polymerase sigma-70 factor (ECF subfamily)